MRLNVVIVTGGLTFDGNTDHEKALGGSETAIINMGRSLAKQGHYVRIFCSCDREGAYDGVSYFDHSRFAQFITHGQCDVCIVARHHSFLATHKINSKLNILWNHDVLSDPASLNGNLWQYDYLYCLTDYHKKLYLDALPELKGHVKIIPNGVESSLLSDMNLPVKEKRHRVMFTSRPERGLFSALRLYEAYGDKDLELLICNYETIDDPNVKRIEEACTQKIAQLINDGFKVSVNRFPKKDLYKEISQSKAVIYPTEFPEIFCISAIEAQACGAAYITTDDFALKEVVGYERCAMDSDDVLKTGFPEMLMKVLRDDEYRHCLEKKGIEHVKKYTWDNVASTVVNDIFCFFENRSQNKRGIIERLVYESDLITAKRLIENEYSDSCNELNDLYQDILIKTKFLKDPELYKYIYEDVDTHEKMDYNELIRVDRLQWPSEMVTEHGLKSVFSYGCHTGVSETHISNMNPECEVYGYDLSAQVINKANETKKEFAQNKDNLTFSHKMPDQNKKFDAIFIGEVLEHVDDPEGLVDQLEKHLVDGGMMMITLPRGAWEWLSHEQNMQKNVVYHVHHFEWWDLEHMFGNKDSLDIIEYSNGSSFGYCGEGLGNYLISYRKNGAKTQKRHRKKKSLMTRPYQSISACIIARDAHTTIEKLIDSIHFEMDEIVVGIDHESGECPELIERIEKYPKAKWFYLSKRIVKDKLGFAAARNETVKRAKSEWVFWIDTDEVLLKKAPFRKFLDGPFFNAFNVFQQHPQIDSFLEADKPQRLFRKSKGEFVGYIHEQVQSKDDINETVSPSIVISDCHVINYGEIHEGMRRNKAMNRNLELLQVDVEKNVDERLKQGKEIRYMTIVLLMRDFLNRMIYSKERFGTFKNRDSIESSLPQMKSLFKKFFADRPEDCYYAKLAHEMLIKGMEYVEDGVEYEVKYGDVHLKTRVEENDIDACIDSLKRALKQK